MEVFMRNLPTDLTDQGLKSQLMPLIQPLRISDWACQSQRRKPFGSILFLHAKDGDKFLRKYGEQLIQGFTPGGKPRSRARLQIFNRAVYCTPSKNSLDPFALKALAKVAEDRRNGQEQHQPKPPEDTKVIFGAHFLSCGYYSYFKDDLVYVPEVEWSTPQGVAKFVKNALIITFNSRGGLIRVEFPFRIIDSVVASPRMTTLTLTLWESPRFFEVADPNAVMMDALAIRTEVNQNLKTTRTRLVALPNGSRQHHQVLGQSLVYRISAWQDGFHDNVQKLRLRDLLSIVTHEFAFVPPYEQKSLTDGLRAFNAAVSEYVGRISFNVLYQLEALVKNGYLLPWTVQELMVKIAKNGAVDDNGPSNVASNTYSISGQAVKKLFLQIPFPSFETPASTFSVDGLWDYLQENEKEIRQGVAKELISERARQNLTMVYKVQVTPTSIALGGPEPEAKNRILRRFPDHTEYFVRMQFCDEDGRDLHFNAEVSNQRIYERFKQIFTNGLSIGGRVYGFLGFSHSSLRSHAAWFMASFVHNGSLETYVTVIRGLGKFSHIQSPARCAARIGQAFSETPFAISLAQEGITSVQMADVKSKDEKRVFSDGVGTISRQVMEAIHAAMPQRIAKSAPTCFQIRLGGAKGMLGLDERIGNVHPKAIFLRHSMVKFQSDVIENLEICDMAKKPIPMVLNRQMIKILEDMGVPDAWFLNAQNRELKRLRLITAHTHNSVAFLKHRKIADQVGLPQLIKRLDKIGTCYKNDDFLRSVVQAAVLQELRLLKHKARIPIDQGVTLFGIMDETGFLEEGSIYVTFDRASYVRGSAADLNDREMIVTRSPALHPGDIQLAFNHIPPPGHPLRALKNCIVFSRKGTRDLPSCLSGGDLDGDIYNAIWDHGAVQECKRLFEPADYPRVDPRDIGRPVEREDMSDFFINFMSTDQLGLIAVKHMILADQREAGTVDKDCMLLAQLHSTGVDYSKTGIPVDMSQLRGIKYNRYRPDFLAPAPPANIKNRTEIYFEAPIAPSSDQNDEDDDMGPQFQYYASEKILGQLYRAIDEKKIWSEHVKAPHTTRGPDVWGTLLADVNRLCAIYIGKIAWERLASKAMGIRATYEDAINNAMVDYSEHAAKPLTELEVFTGTIFNKSGVQNRRQRDMSLRLKDEFDRIAQWAAALLRKRSMDSIAADDNDDDGESDTTEAPSINRNASDNEDPLALSLACLNVGCETVQSNGQGRGRGFELQSFKVIAACCVLKELDAAVNRAEIMAGMAAVSDSFVGVRTGR
ncbi:RNA dependent RNA polymerase-domain-containing protein [Pseudomassariella vexata]|uniref:RNA-dependent RNA polymerase n=1 Tax=Pseudomassariella vexata TaxID=1141098 RepID=A0A1Y2DC66_9PEZI|nr:RNA dependent RNA polymerase-domain-containing protein [Pseudomassariella vexata]ORY56863.1 RNA dependent RNA polymerase-domain-containing protein [Pseudomassariella vexata]